ncbi:MAG: ABC transporter substrate-binding protein [Actinomycetota bacterium]
MRRSPAVRILVLLAAFALIAAACAKKSATQTGGGEGGGQVVEGGTLRIGSGGPDNINPFVGTSVDSFSIYNYAYPFLIKYNETLDDFVGDLAESWEVSEDGRTWTFHLKPGAQWSDGEPLDSEDVKFSFELYRLKGMAPEAVFRHIKKIETPDPTTFVMTLDEPVGTTLKGLVFGYILPEQTWGKFGNDVDALRDFKNPAPWISGGPFILTEHKQDEIDIFEANPNFYGPKPHIEGFGIRAFTDDDAQIAALQNGEIDMIAYLAPTGVDVLKQDGFNVHQAPGYEFEELIVNSSPLKKDHPELKDPELRKAFELATNRERMIEVAKLGLARPASTIVPPAAGKYHNSSIQPLSYNPAEANRILDAAGYERGDDGIRVTPDGTKMEYTVYTQIGQVGINRTFEILKEGFDEIGVKIKQKPLAYNALLDLNYSWDGNDATYKDWELMIWSWTPDPDPDFILSVLQCNQYGIWSDTGYCDKDYDRMYNDQAVTVNDKERKEIIWEMQEKIYNERPYIVFFNNDQLSAASPNWTGYGTGPDGPISSYNRLSLTNVQQTG